MDRQRFCRLWIRNRTPGAQAGRNTDAESVYALIDGRYTQASRYYHDGQHIVDCLRWFDRYSDQIEDPDAVELAVWFHDACFSPDPQGHEQRATELLRQLAQGSIESQRLDAICNMILLTTHQQCPDNAEQALMLDIDLASFARPWPLYLRDTARCRAEMPPSLYQDYGACQLGFLRKLLGREQIYYHPLFRANHEADARANITRLIGLLDARSARGRTLTPGG
ncbi:MAG: putative metal-dependent HD superfamily phosphohydrolase [Motiliproteus sp.]|jgi:predicted metal-dependent HD superfamily phosphohydrolase